MELTCQTPFSTEARAVMQLPPSYLEPHWQGTLHGMAPAPVPSCLPPPWINTKYH